MKGFWQSVSELAAMRAAIPEERRNMCGVHRFPLAYALLDLWAHPYSTRYLKFTHRLLVKSMARGCASVFD